MRVLKPGCNGDFAAKAFAGYVAGELGRQNLDDDWTSQGCFGRQKDLRHATAPKLSFNYVGIAKRCLQLFAKFRHSIHGDPRDANVAATDDRYNNLLPRIDQPLFLEESLETRGIGSSMCHKTEANRMSTTVTMPMIAATGSVRPIHTSATYKVVPVMAADA